MHWSIGNERSKKDRLSVVFFAFWIFAFVVYVNQYLSKNRISHAIKLFIPCLQSINLTAVIKFVFLSPVCWLHNYKNCTSPKNWFYCIFCAACFATIYSLLIDFFLINVSSWYDLALRATCFVDRRKIKKSYKKGR